MSATEQWQVLLQEVTSWIPLLWLLENEFLSLARGVGPDHLSGPIISKMRWGIPNRQPIKEDVCLSQKARKSQEHKEVLEDSPKK